MPTKKQIAKWCVALVILVIIVLIAWCIVMGFDDNKKMDGSWSDGNIVIKIEKNADGELTINYPGATAKYKIEPDSPFRISYKTVDNTDISEIMWVGIHRINVKISDKTYKLKKRGDESYLKKS